MAKSEQQLNKVTVISPKRQGHGGIYAGGRYWQEGQHEAELTDKELQAVAARPGLVVLQAGKVVSASSGPAPALHQEALTADELAGLQEYRAHRAKAAAEQAAYEKEQASAGVAKSGESKPDALERASHGGGVPPGAAGSDMRPLQNADILAGEDPPAGPGANVKPIEPHTSAKSSKK